MSAVTMDELPDELIMLILSYINPLEQSLVMTKVCRKWNDFINSRIIRIKRAKHYDELHEGLQVILVTNAEPSVDHSDTLVSYAIRLTPRLRELTINCDFPLDISTFKALSSLVHLRHLDVFAKKQILNKDTHINRGITSFVANETMSNGFFATLKELKLSSFHMYGRANHYVPKEMMLFLSVQATHLRDLTLRCIEMSDIKLKVLSQCVNLLSLQLYMCSMLTGRGIQYIVCLSNLKQLHVTGANLLRSKGVMSLVNQLPTGILHLNLSGSDFGNEHCSALVRRLPGLRSLELWRTRLERDGALRLAHRLRVLEHLDVDLEFRLTQIKMLEHHCTLTKLRCCWLGMVSTRLRLTSALQVVSGRFLRSTSEGPAADLFFYWTREVAPPPHAEVTPPDSPSSTPPDSPPHILACIAIRTGVDGLYDFDSPTLLSDSSSD